MKLITKHLLIFTFFSLLYMLSFRMGIFSFVSVFFYRGIILLFLLSVLMLIALILIKKHVKFENFLNYYDIALAVIIFFSVNIIYFTHIPVTADRSVTVFMLGDLNKNRSGLTTEDMTKDFNDIYFGKNKNIEKRFEEQMVSGNVKLENGKYVLTGRGEFVAKIYKAVANLYGIPEDNINP